MQSKYLSFVKPKDKDDPNYREGEIKRRDNEMNNLDSNQYEKIYKVDHLINSPNPDYHQSYNVNYNFNNTTFHQGSNYVINNANNLQTVGQISKPPILNKNLVNQNEIPNQNIIPNLSTNHMQINEYNCTNNQYILPPNEEEKKEKDSSENLKKYIERSFAKCRNEDDRKECEKILHKIITNAQNKKVLLSRNWDKFPLPQLPFEKEGKAISIILFI